MNGPRRYRFGPLEQRGVVGPLRPGQLVILAVAGAIGLGSLYVLRNFAGLVLGLLILGAGAGIVLAPLEGRSVGEWAPVVVRWLLRSREQKRGFRSTAPTAGAQVGGDGRVRHSPSLPPELGELDMLEVPYGRDQVGVIRDRRAGTFTAAIAVRAGAFGLRDWGEQERKLEAWGSVLASCARDGSPVRRLQWIERRCPGRATSWWRISRPSAIGPCRSIPISFAPTSNSSRPPRRLRQEHEILIAIQIDPRRAGRELRRLGGGDEAACELLLREAESLAERLTIG